MKDLQIKKDKEIIKKEFLDIVELFKRLNGEMCHIVSSYYIWDTLIFSRSVLVTGKDDAEKNVKTINDFKYFFLQVEDSLLKTVVIGILKFFDKDGRSISLDNLVKKIDKIKNDISLEVITEIYPNRFNKNELGDKYPISLSEDIEFIKNIKLKHGKSLEILKDIRDKQFAHIDIEKIECTFIPTEVEKLILDTQEMFNMLSNSLNQSSVLWITFERESISNTKFLLETLQKGEMQRKFEFDKKYGIKNEM